MANSAITVPDMSVGGLTTPVNLREEFSKVPGVQLRQKMSLLMERYSPRMHRLALGG